MLDPLVRQDVLGRSHGTGRVGSTENGQVRATCGSCLSAETSVAGKSALAGQPIGRPQGPRAPRPDIKEIRHDGEPVRIVIDQTGRGAGHAGPPLVIEGAQWLAEFFFRRDPSAVGAMSYDTWIAATQQDSERMTRIIDEDITAVNRTMAARTPHQTWAPIVAGNDWAWLTALDPEWDLFDLEPVAWREAGIATRLRKAFGAIHRPGLGIAVTTKVLHIKRPMLVPVLDSLVIAQIGGRVDDVPATWVAAVEHIRAVGRANLPQLRLIRDHLHRVGLPDRTHLRVLDALLWTSSPGSNLFSSLDGWERVVRLGGPSGRDGRLRSSNTALRPCPRRGSRSGSPGSSRRANAGCSSRGSGRRRSCDARWRRPRGRTVPPPTSGGTRGSGSSSTSRPRQSCVPGPGDPGGGGSGGRSSGVDSGATNRPMRSCRRLYARRCGRGPGAWRHTSAPGTAGGLAATVGWAESWPVGQHASPACRGPLSRAPVASPRPGPLSRAVRRRPSSRAACRGPPSRAVRRRTRPPWPWLSPPWRAPPPAFRTARPPQPSGPATRVRTAGP